VGGRGYLSKPGFLPAKGTSIYTSSIQQGYDINHNKPNLSAI